ncbi:hypothetical protein FG386_000929 [Cryptosporidium ryanae]|uniref:uncharacterized protein n=1 Tax=Cryptosporidium ryanae TaxID=515981 RepID=UPI00351A5F3B|nr:hypothetical protein FG386_000929 [Cryptosporidium ryanae]
MDGESSLFCLKEKGNEYYSKGEYNESIRVYTKILDSINDKFKCDDSVENNINNESFQKEYSDLKFKVLLNRCASYIKIKDFENGLNDSNKVLEINGNDVKGLFRRANCLSNINNIDDINKLNNINKAIDDLKKALIIEKNNKEVKDLLLKLIEEKGKTENNIQINQLPSEIIKNIYNLLVNECDDTNDVKIDYNKELNSKLNDLYLYINSNGNHDIILNTSSTENIISIFKHKSVKLGNQLIYVPINNSKDICNSIVKNSWSILSSLLEDNDCIISSLLDENYNNSGNFSNISNNDLKFKKYDANSKNKQLINFRNSFKKNNIINYTEIKNFINNCIIFNVNKENLIIILNNIFNIIFCINDQYIHDIDYINFLISLIDIGTPFINTNDNANVLISLILRNLSILFKNRNSITNKLKALEYSSEIENLINSIFKLSYEYYNQLLFNNPSSNNENIFNNIINNCEFILSIIFSLLSEKERSDNIDINAISNNHFIQKYIIKSMTKYYDNHNSEFNINNDDNSEYKYYNWIISDYLSFVTGLIGIKVLHFSNRGILKSNIINYPHIIHCILLFIVTNNKEYNSLLNHCKNYNSSPYPLSDNVYNSIIKTNCIEVISLLMEYSEIRGSIAKDEDTVVILYNNCKYIVDDEYNNKSFNINKLNSCCRLINGISKFSVENNTILSLIIEQLNISELLKKIWFIFISTDNNYIEKNSYFSIYWSCIQNYFEILTILSMHKAFKIILLSSNMIDNNGLFILSVLNIFNIFDIHNDSKNNKYPPHSFFYLYLSFIQNLLTCNESDPSTEIQNINDDSNKNNYFLKRQRYYKQLNSQDYFDFDQSQLEELEMMYSKLPKYSKAEKNGIYDRGDESLVNRFRNIIMDNTNVISHLYLILNNYLNNNLKSSNENNKSFIISSSLPIILSISNNICDLITINNNDSKLILLHRGKIVQNGGLKCLLDSITIIENEINDNFNNKSSRPSPINKKYLFDRMREYKQAISRLLIYISPSLISYKLLLESAIKIQSLLDDEHELLQYESALAITNILSKSSDKLSEGEDDSVTVRIYNNGLGWNLLKNLCFSDNILLRSTGLEGLCNFCNKDFVVSKQFINSKSNGIEDLKLFVAFSLENNIRIQRASLGALAMLSSYSDVSKIILNNWNNIGNKLIELSNDNNVIKNIELKERLLFCLNNLLSSSQNNNDNNDVISDNINSNIDKNTNNIDSILVINKIIKESISLLI